MAFIGCSEVFGLGCAPEIWWRHSVCFDAGSLGATLPRPTNGWGRIMPIIEPIKELSLVECEAEADVYLKSLLYDPENRSMDVIQRYAQQINDPRFRAYYVNKGREMLKEGYGIG
jgi:hypothetical protein